MFKKGKPAFTVIPILICAAIVAVIVWVVLQAGTYTINEPVYRFENGVKFAYSGRTDIRRDDDEGVYLRNGGKDEPIGASPLYYADDKSRVLLPRQMIYVDPLSMKTGRTGYNTLVKLGQDGEDVLTINGRETGISGGFIYDGTSTYLFLEPMKIEWSGQKRELDALSYAIVYYDLRVEIYDPAGGAPVVEQTGPDRVIASSISDREGGFRLDLSMDILRTGKGESLLITQPSLLNYLTPEILDEKSAAEEDAAV
jgi:hypothetical protein